ncbi:hypothetical protein L0P72_16195, partial [[Ruminococcus] torques]
KKEKIQIEDAGSIYDSVFPDCNFRNAHLVRTSWQLFQTAVCWWTSSRNDLIGTEKNAAGYAKNA